MDVATGQTFQSRTWKLAAVFAYLGMHMGAILVTVVVPLAFICMGETKIEDVATHSASFQSISYWLIGIGGITFFASTMAVIAAFLKSRSFRIFVVICLTVNIVLTFALLIWGIVPTEARKSYLRDSWEEMDSLTKNAIQKHFSCCGFESAAEYRKPDATCYADQDLRLLWPDGCYDRTTSASPSAPEVTYPDGKTTPVGSSTANVFLLGFLLPFLVLIAVQTTTTIACICGITRAERTAESAAHAEVYHNHAADDIAGEVGENGRATGNGSMEKIPTVSKGVDKFVDDVSVDDKGSAASREKKWYEKIPDAISSTMESGFYWLGVKVGRDPKMTIALSLLLTFVLFFGLLQRTDQPTGSRGFLPETAPVIENYVAYRQTFIIEERDHYMLVVDDKNVLPEKKFNAMLDIHNAIHAANDSKGRSFDQICFQSAGTCKQRSLFELWGFNETVLRGLKDEEIVGKLNNNLTSPVFRDEVDVSSILGGISRTDGGEISGARAHLMHYVTRFKDDDWEKKFIDVGRQNYDDFSVYVESRGSRSLEAGSSYRRELPLLFAGFGLIFIYIIIMTGKFSRLEHRTYIALMGIVTAGLSMGSGIGLSASLGFEWSVIHLVAPFLIIGIGVDDMFILIQAWNTIDDDPELRKKPMPEKAGHALKSAGVSITVTSVTDLVAFAVGASSELGSFASFSIYVAISIILLFFLQCTFFLACTVLDQRRREERYDACLACCYKHDESYKPNSCSEREFFSTFFEDYLGRVVQYMPVQIAVVLLTLGLTAIMAWGFTLLKVSFDPDWYLQADSYLLPFGEEFGRYFHPGQRAGIYVINADFYVEREKLHLLYERLKANKNIDTRSLTSWFENYVFWMATAKNVTDIYASDAFLDAQQFYRSVVEFLTTKGRSFASEVVVRNGTMIGSRFRVKHVEVEEKVDNVDIMDSLQADCDAVGFSEFAFPFERQYFNFAIMKVIRTEVYRNLGITLLCVFLMVLPMIASIQMSFWVVICVVFTIIDVAGSMYFSGLTIETSTIITLLLSVGLAVDYAAHIAHKFLTLKGTKKMRVRVTLGQIGPAVFNGGFSTFLALVLLSGSDTYSYKVFFTVFVCVVGYGLWNGLIFLPCILGLVGPPPHITAVEAKLTQRHLRRKNKINNQGSTDSIEMGNNSIERA